MTPLLFVVVLTVLVLIVAGGLGMMATFRRTVDQGQALIVNKLGTEPQVTFTGMVVVPVLHRSETMDTSLKTIHIARAGQEGLICSDNIRADIKVAFFVRVNKTVDDVLRVASSIGVKRASDQGTLEELFVAKFSEALKTVGKQMEFEQLYTHRDLFKNRIVEVIGTDLNGYVLDDCAIDFLEQTPLSSLDPANILDAQGIRKITEITTLQNVQTDQLRQQERKTLTKQSVDSDEAVFELERRRAEASAKQHREIESVQAREAAETAKIQAEERTRSKLAEIKEHEATEVAEFNKLRQTEVADKDRERVLAIKTEQVEKDRQMERIAREREVELTRISMEKDVEIQKKEIADVISTRIAVDKKVAEEEERIKDLRVGAEAKRQANARVTAAEGLAQESVVKQLRTAEAEEKAAEFTARKTVTEAKARLEQADKHTLAKIRLAEGTQAEAAAEGLAKAKVAEADAAAFEKKGLVEARIQLEKMSAEAKGRDAIVAIREKEGTTEASVKKQLMVAEADGLQQKLLAMQKMEGAARAHEEFRLRLENDRAVAMEAMETQVKVAEQQSKVMGQAFENANIQIMGGDGQFFDQFLKAASLGNAMDGFLAHSDVAKSVAQRFTGGGTQGIGIDAVAKLIAEFAAKATPEDKARLLGMLDQKGTPVAPAHKPE